MISYEKYLKFESGKIDIYDIAMDDAYDVSLLWRCDSFLRIEKEQFSYKSFQKCNVIIIRVRYATKSTIELSRMANGYKLIWKKKLSGIGKAFLKMLLM